MSLGFTNTSDTDMVQAGRNPSRVVYLDEVQGFSYCSIFLVCSIPEKNDLR